MTNVIPQRNLDYLPEEMKAELASKIDKIWSWSSTSRNYIRLINDDENEHGKKWEFVAYHYNQESDETLTRNLGKAFPCVVVCSWWKFVYYNWTQDYMQFDSNLIKDTGKNSSDNVQLLERIKRVEMVDWKEKTTWDTVEICNLPVMEFKDFAKQKYPHADEAWRTKLKSTLCLYLWIWDKTESWALTLYEITTSNWNAIWIYSELEEWQFNYLGKKIKNAWIQAGITLSSEEAKWPSWMYYKLRFDFNEWLWQPDLSVLAKCKTDEEKKTLIQWSIDELKAILDTRKEVDKYLFAQVDKEKLLWAGPKPQLQSWVGF